MQLRCGQCGLRLRQEDIPDTPTVTCPECGHSVTIAHLRERPSAEEPEVQFADQGEQGFAEEARLALGRKIRITCGKCGRGLKVETRFAGKGVRCPACKERIRIPFPDEEMEFEFASVKATSGEQIEELAEDVQAEAVETIQDTSEQDVQLILKQRGVSPMWATIIALVVIGWLGALGFWLHGKYGRPDDGGSDVAEVQTTQPETPTGPATQPEIDPPPVQPESNDFGVVATELASFAGEPVFCARPGLRFLRVTLDVQAGGKALALQARGKDFTLDAGRGSVLQSLGLADGDSVLPRRGHAGTIRVEPGKTVRTAILFELPVSVIDATLKVRDAGQVNVGPFPVERRLSDRSLPGAYVESAPRNLKPLLRDPVMAAVQSAPNHRLTITAGNGELTAVIREAGVGGPVKRRGDGMYDVELRRGTDTLKSKLRLTDNGQRVILYLADRPFHQIVYQRAER